MNIPSYLLPANMGGPITPEAAARKRSMGEGMLYAGMDTSPIASPWQGVSRVAQALVGGYGMRKADAAEEEGRKSASSAMAKLLQSGSPDNAAIAEVMENPWLSDGQGRLAAGLLEQNFKRSQPDWQTVVDKNSGDVYRWNGNDPNSKPELFYDAAPAPRDLMNVPKGGNIYDPNNQEWVTPPTGPQGVAAADLDDVAKITKMYEAAPGVSRYRTVVPSLTSMQKSLKDPSAISDLDFVYGVAKILDPESVVRESETGLVIQSQSLPDQVVGQMNKILNGEAALTPGVRKDLYRLARRRGEAFHEQAQRESQYFQDLGRGYGITPEQFRALDALPEYDETQIMGDVPNPSAPSNPQRRALQQKYGLEP